MALSMRRVLSFVGAPSASAYARCIQRSTVMASGSPRMARANTVTLGP